MTQRVHNPNMNNNNIPMQPAYFTHNQQMEKVLFQANQNYVTEGHNRGHSTFEPSHNYKYQHGDNNCMNGIRDTTINSNVQSLPNTDHQQHNVINNNNNLNVYQQHHNNPTIQEHVTTDLPVYQPNCYQNNTINNNNNYNVPHQFCPNTNMAINHPNYQIQHPNNQQCNTINNSNNYNSNFPIPYKNHQHICNRSMPTFEETLNVMKPLPSGNISGDSKVIPMDYCPRNRVNDAHAVKHIPPGYSGSLNSKATRDKKKDIEDVKQLFMKYAKPIVYKGYIDAAKSRDSFNKQTIFSDGVNTLDDIKTILKQLPPTRYVLEDVYYIYVMVVSLKLQI